MAEQKYPFSRGQKILITTILTLSLLLIIIIFDIDYQDNDDYVYCLITSGAYSGEPSAMTVYEGYLYGSFISFLYKTFPGKIEWYAVITHALYLICFTLITYKLLSIKIKKTFLFKIFLLILIYALQLYIILSPQFTTLAGELTIVATSLLIGKPNTKTIIISSILIFIGTQVRIQSVPMVLVPLIPLVIYSWKPLKNFYGDILIFGGVLAIALIINIQERRIYISDENWNKYLEFNHPRGVIEQNPCRITGLSQLDDPMERDEYELMCNFKLIDGTIIANEKLSKCADYVYSNKVTSIKLNLPSYFNMAVRYGAILIAIWSIILIFYLKKRSVVLLYYFIATILIMLGEFCYCIITSYAKDRLIICMLFSILLAISYLTFISLQHLTKIKRAIIYSIVICLSLQFTINSILWINDVNERLDSSKEISNLINRLPYDKVHIISIPMNAEIYSISKTSPFRKCIGKGWLNNNPLHSKIYCNYKSLVNKIPIIINKGDTKNIKTILNVLNKRYTMPCNAKIIVSSENYDVYMIKPMHFE